MQIHVVQTGQTLFQIAQLYSTTASAIAEANEIPNPNRLVVGQTMVIPIVGSFYWVQPGDSLFSIAQQFGMTYQELARINGISVTQPLQVGLRLYIPPRPRRNAETNAYAEPFGNVVSPELEQSARQASPLLTYLAVFSYQVQEDGSLKAPPLNNFQAIARGNRTALMMAVTNLVEGQFSTELGRIILTDENVQNRLLDNIIATAEQVNFKDIHFDFEFLPPELRDSYSAFLRKAKSRFAPRGLLLSVAVAPKTSSDQKGILYEAHDYGAIGAIADLVIIMTYEWGWSGGPPMAVSPIGPVTDVLQYALTQMPAGKIMMGQNLYGYDWTLPFVPGGPFAKVVSPQRAIQIAVENNVAISYDNIAQAPFFYYTDNQGRRHVVWFEDARSIQAKFNLIKELDIRGISYWKLGISFPQNWLLIEENFNVIKL